MWRRLDTCYYIVPSTRTWSRVAAFDLDGTLIFTASGRKPFQIKSPDDWVMPENVVALLEEASIDSTIVIFTNQKGFTDIVRQKIEKIRDYLYRRMIEPYIFVSSADDKFRKPRTGMFDLFEQVHDKKIEEAFYCGDAAGDTNYPPYNWGNADSLFAKNNGLIFYEPREIFEEDYDCIFHPDVKRLTIMVGTPGSGKSTLASKIKNSVVLNQDKIKNKKKLMKMFDEAVAEGKNIVIDRMNATIAERMEFIEKAEGYHILIVWVVIDGRYFNELREDPVPETVYAKYSKNFEPPSELEGDVCIISYIEP